MCDISTISLEKNDSPPKNQLSKKTRGKIYPVFLFFLFSKYMTGWTHILKRIFAMHVIFFRGVHVFVAIVLFLAIWVQTLMSVTVFGFFYLSLIYIAQTNDHVKLKKSHIIVVEMFGFVFSDFSQFGDTCFILESLSNYLQRCHLQGIYSEFKAEEVDIIQYTLLQKLE
ncbi:hypothetical protein ACJX0J_025993 [Zea mays]